MLRNPSWWRCTVVAYLRHDSVNASGSLKTETVLYGRLVLFVCAVGAYAELKMAELPWRNARLSFFSSYHPPFCRERLRR